MPKRNLPMFALATLACVSSCAVWAAQNSTAGANRNGRTCQNDTSAGAFDLMVAATVATLLRATNTFDSQPAWGLVPATFLLSGGLGVFFADRCQRREADEGPSLETPRTIPSTDANAQGDADFNDAALPTPLPHVDGSPTSDTSLDGSAKPSGTTPPPPTSSATSAPEGNAPTAGSPPKTLPGLPCSVIPIVMCPDNFSCALIDGIQGICTADH